MLQTIENNLGRQNLEVLKGSYLGHFLKIPEMKIQKHLMVELLSRLEASSLDRNILSFCVNMQSIEFFPEDFALITSLKFGMLDELRATSSHFHRDMFIQKKEYQVL